MAISSSDMRQLCILRDVWHDCAPFGRLPVTFVVLHKHTWISSPATYLHQTAETARGLTLGVLVLCTRVDTRIFLANSSGSVIPVVALFAHRMFGVAPLGLRDDIQGVTGMQPLECHPSSNPQETSHCDLKSESKVTIWWAEQFYFAPCTLSSFSLLLPCGQNTNHYCQSLLFASVLKFKYK